MQLVSLFRHFILLGTVSFGGYMALVAMLRDYFVVQKKILEDDDVAEAVTLASILPGPLAVMVVAYLGNKLRGLPGALVSVIGVLVPSFLLVLGLSILYFNYNEAFPFNSVMLGVLPVVGGIIISVGITMVRMGCRQVIHYLVFILVLGLMILFPFKITIIILLVGSFVIGGLIKNHSRNNPITKVADYSYREFYLVPVLVLIFCFIFYYFSSCIYVQLVSVFSSVSLTLFGGGYVVIPVLQSILVDELRWVTTEEFIYGIAVGQITPGPILISSVFFGFKVAGYSGAILATLGIFMPSIILILTLSKLYSTISNNTFISGAMELVKPAVAGLVLFSGFDMVLRAGLDENIYFVLMLSAFSFILNFWIKFKPVFLIIIGGFLGFLIF